jgi:hypothetical protein
MQIYIKLKQAGKRRLLLDNQAITIEELGENPTLRDLIKAVVTQQVNAYNAKTLEQPLVDFLTETQIQHAAENGKIGFGTIYNEGKADLAQAHQNAIEAHIDGLFAVGIDGKMIEKLAENISIKENAVVLFVKLTLLVG